VLAVVDQVAAIAEPGGLDRHDLVHSVCPPGPVAKNSGCTYI
jgi:hypothetical protein